MLPGATSPFNTAPVTTPVGALVAYAGPVATPDGPPGTMMESMGWMPCDGRVLMAAEYPRLFAAIGYQYGGSNETFQISDLRGAFAPDPTRICYLIRFL